MSTYSVYICKECAERLGINTDGLIPALAKCSFCNTFGDCYYISFNSIPSGGRPTSEEAEIIDDASSERSLPILTSSQKELDDSIELIRKFRLHRDAIADNSEAAYENVNKRRLPDYNYRQEDLENDNCLDKSQ